MASNLEPLFRGHTLLRAVIDAVLEDRCGRVITVATGTPHAALMDFGCYRIPGGDSTSHEARDLLADLAGPCEIVLPDDDGWSMLVDEIFGARVHDRSMQSFVPGPDLESRTMALAAAVPEGYQLQRFDAEIAAMAGPDTAPHGVEVLGGPARFVECGFGWALLSHGVLACAATSYAASARYVEIAIATHPAHRQRGLAACAAAAMIQDALDRGLEPHWNAYNPVSKQLARRLGYVDAGLVKIMALDFEEES